MKKFDDEFIQNYIDGDLAPSVISEFEKEISRNDNLKKRLNEFRVLESGLKKMKEYEAPASFTALVMSKIMKPSRAVSQTRNFFFTISTLFLSACLLIIGYISYLIVQSGGFQNGTDEAGRQLSSQFIAVGNFLITFFSSMNLSVLGSILSIGIIISAFFFYENVRLIKKTLNK